MEQTVVFYDNEQVQAADFNNIEQFASDSIDHVVADAVSPNTHFTGLTVSQTDATDIAVAAGRLYAGGAVYATAGQSFNIAAYLPVATSKIIALTAWGSTVQADAEARDFLINVDTGQMEPQNVNLLSQRQCNLGLAIGIESPSPQIPTIPNTALLIATITLSPTGITAIAMATQNTLPQSFNLAARTTALETWQGQTDPRISTITSDISKLGSDLLTKPNISEVRDMAADIARLKALIGLPTTLSDYGTDHFIDKTYTDTTQAGYAAAIAEGIRFPDGTSATIAFGLLNALDPNVGNNNDLLLPAFTKVLRLSNIASYAGPQLLSGGQFQTSTYSIRPISRSRCRFGNNYPTSSNFVYLSAANTPLATKHSAFTKSGETLTFPAGYVSDTFNTNHQSSRVAGYFADNYTDPYWAINLTTASVTGVIHAQVFLNTQDGWLTQLGLFFPQVGSSGNVTVSICRADSGVPDLTAVICTVTLTQANMQQFPNETLLALPPTFLQGGSRYALVIQSGGAHGLATCSGLTVVSGQYLTLLNGGWQLVTAPTTSMMFNAYFAKFASGYVTTQLNPISLTGGMSGIDFLFEDVTPKSCQLKFEVQVGGTWYALTQDSLQSGIFATAPALVPLRVSFIGTLDVHPAFKLSTSQVSCNTKATAFTHWSTVRTVASATTSVQVQLDVDNWNPAKHTLACSVIVGSTTVTPSVTTTRSTDTGVRITYSFTVPSTTTFRIKTVGSTTDVTALFVVSDETYIAF